MEWRITAIFDAVGNDGWIHRVIEQTAFVAHRGARHGAPAGRPVWHLDDGDPVELVDQERGEYRVVESGVRLRRLHESAERG